MPENTHALYLAGALYGRGVSETWRDDSRALEYASRLQSLNLKLYDMSADQLRMMHYANRGDSEELEKHRQRVGVHAIQRGTAWQVETWTFSALITVYMRTQDAAGLKNCMAQLERLSAEVAALRVGHARAVAAYCVLRGTPGEALDAVGKGEQPMQLVGWCRGEGVRARAYNALGQHARAKETCLSVLGQLTPAELELCALNLGLQSSWLAQRLGSVTLRARRCSCPRYWTSTPRLATRSPWARCDPALFARHERLARIADGAQQHLASDARER